MTPQIFSGPFAPQARAGAAACIGLALVGFAALFQVRETQQAVVTWLGQPVRVINSASGASAGAGLALRVPLFESVVMVDKRSLLLPVAGRQITSADQQRLEVDAIIRYRVTDPVLLVRTAGSVEHLGVQLEPIVEAALHQRLGALSAAALLTPEQGATLDQIRTQVDAQAHAYGVSVQDVSISRIALPAGAALDNALARMQAARDVDTAAIRADGQKRALIAMTDANARAAQIYAASFGKDPAFYDFYRAMKSYETSLADPATRGSTTVVLTPDTDYLRQFRGGHPK